MNSLMAGGDTDRAREVIETAIQENDFCATCGQPMAIAEHGRALWIECISLRSQQGLRRFFGEAMHERHPIDLPFGDLELAA